MSELIILTHVTTASVNQGFIPAARRLGFKVVLLTDQPEDHRRHFSAPGLAAYPDEILACDVFNPIAVIEAVLRRGQRPAALFSNSDHLQTSTAIAAAYFDLPAKDWRVTYRAKNKAEMRNFFAARSEFQPAWHHVVWTADQLAAVADQIPWPCIAKPREGVGSRQVKLVHDIDELQAHCAAVWRLEPAHAILLEEYIEGPLCTLETLGDGEQLRVLGGFQVRLSPAPHFLELEARWGIETARNDVERVLAQLRAFGVNFGACHTEFVPTPNGPRLIEINYRGVGDYRDFLLQETLGIPYFEAVLRLHLGAGLAAVLDTTVSDRGGAASPAVAAAAIRYFAAEQAGEIVRVPASFSQREAAWSLHYHTLRQVGERVAPSFSNRDYLGVLRGSGCDAEGLGQAMERASAALQWEIRP